MKPTSTIGSTLPGPSGAATCPRRDEPVSPAGLERMHRALACLDHRHRCEHRSADTASSAASSWREALLAEFEIRLLEGTMLEPELARAREWLSYRGGLLGPRGSSDAVLAAAAAEIETSLRAVYDWLARPASLADAPWIAIHERAAGTPADGADPIVFSAPPIDPSWEALAVRNLMTALDASPWHRDESRGARRAARAWRRGAASCLAAAIARLNGRDAPPYSSVLHAWDGVSPGEAVGAACLLRARLRLSARYAERMRRAAPAPQSDFRTLRAG